MENPTLELKAVKNERKFRICGNILSGQCGYDKIHLLA